MSDRQLGDKRLRIANGVEWIHAQPHAESECRRRDTLRANLDAAAAARAHDEEEEEEEQGTQVREWM